MALSTTQDTVEVNTRSNRCWLAASAVAPVVPLHRASPDLPQAWRAGGIARATAAASRRRDPGRPACGNPDSRPSTPAALVSVVASVDPHRHLLVQSIPSWAQFRRES